MLKPTHTYFTEIASGLLIILFVYTALSKLMDAKQFQSVLSQGRLTRPMAGVLSWMVPLTELSVACLLFVPGTRIYGLLLSFLLMSVFTLYIAGMLLFSPTLPCSCGGVMSALSWRDHLFFNIAFTLLALGGWRLERRRLPGQMGEAF